MDNQDKLHKQIKRQDAYNKMHYERIGIRLKPEDNEAIENYCKQHNISKASFIIKSCRYIIDNSINFNNTNTDKE